MLGAPTDPFIAGLQASVVCALFLSLGYLVVDVVAGRALDRVVCLALAFPAVVALACAAMLVHIVSGGILLSSPALVRWSTVACFSVLLALRLRARGGRRDRSRAGLIALTLVVTAAILVWGRAAFEIIPAGVRGDTNLHMGWASQLMNGERLPTSPLTGPIPNYYPWLFHGLVAWVAALTPGGRAFHALAPLLLMQVMGAVGALFGLGYVAFRRYAHGIACAVLGALTGGFGFLTGIPERLVDEVRGPEVGRYWGDLLERRSYNLSFHNLAPVYPRDVAYALVPVVLLLLVLGLRRGRRSFLVAAGSVVGSIGLIGGEAFIAAMVVSLLVVLTGGRGRALAVLCVFGPALAIYSLWLGPLLYNYARFGGFDDLSSDPVVLTPLQILGSWGLVTPLAVAGAVLLARRWSEDGPRIALLYLAATALLVSAAVTLGDSVGGGFETLGRAHRYWPLWFQAAALCGAYAAVWIWDAVGAARAPAPLALVLVGAAVCLASPVLGSRTSMRPRPNPVLTRALQRDGDVWLNELASHRGRCVAAVPRPITVRAFAYSGYRLVWFVWTVPSDNSARVRWSDIYSVIAPDAERRVANRILTTTQGPGFEREVVRFGVDRVVVAGDGHTVIETGSC